MLEGPLPLDRVLEYTAEAVAPDSDLPTAAIVQQHMAIMKRPCANWNLRSVLPTADYEELRKGVEQVVDLSTVLHETPPLHGC
jgi:hypothetical protein